MKRLVEIGFTRNYRGFGAWRTIFGSLAIQVWRIRIHIGDK